MSKSSGNRAVPSFMQDLRLQALVPDSPIYQAMGWEQADLARIASGEMPLTISQIPALVRAAGYVLISEKLSEAVWTLAKAGANLSTGEQATRVAARADVGQQIGDGMTFAAPVTLKMEKKRR